MYSTMEAADALGISSKRLDNILTGPARPLIPPGINGRSRTIQLVVIEIIAIALLLERDLGISMSRGLTLASEFIREPTTDIAIGSLGSLHFDVARLKSILQNALNDVLDGQSRPKRGRPSHARKKKRGASL